MKQSLTQCRNTGLHAVRTIIFISLLLLNFTWARRCNAQLAFTEVGSAITAGPGCFDLTPDAITTGQAGVIWCTTKIDFENPFVITFEATVNDLGGGGADGWVVAFGSNFIATTPANNNAGFLGYYGPNAAYTSNSFGVEFDIFNDGACPGFGDIAADHSSIAENGSPCPNMPEATAVPLLTGGGTIKDAGTFTYRIYWNPVTTTLKVYVGDKCDPIITSVFDYRTIFTAPTAVPWGITGSTGSNYSSETICNITVTSQLLTISGPNTVCAGSTITLSDNFPGGTWSSNNIAVATVGYTTGVVSGKEAGTAIITYSDTCGDIATHAVTVVDTPVATLTASPTTICGGSPVVLTATPSTTGYYYYWTPGGPGPDVRTVTPDVTTVYEVAVSSASTGCTGHASVTVDVKPTPTIEPVPALCQGSITNAIFTPYGGTWTSSTGAITIGASLGVITAISGGSATITYTLGDGCFKTENVSVTDTFVPTITASPNPVCAGTAVTLDATPYSLFTFSYDYTWYPGGIGTGSNTYVVHPTTTTTYTVKVGYGVIGRGMPYCPGMASVTVTVNPAPTISGVLTPCLKATTTLNGTPAGGTWSSSNTAVATISAGGVLSGEGVGLAVITYTDPLGCIGTVTINVLPVSCVCTWVSEGLDFYEFGTSGAVTGGTYTGNFTMENDVTIEGTVTLNDCVMRIAPGKTLTVALGAHLIINNSHLFCCPGDMWRGIAVSVCSGIFICLGPTQGYLEIHKNSIIEDAAIAVSLAGSDYSSLPAGYNVGSGPVPYIFECDSTVFNKDSIGVAITNYSVALTPGNALALHPGYPFLIANTVFTDRDFYPYETSIGGLAATKWPFVWPVAYGTVSGTLYGLKNPYTPATVYEPPYNIDNPLPYPGAAGAYSVAACNYGYPTFCGIFLLNVGHMTGSGATAQFTGLATGAGSGGGAINATTDPIMYDHICNGIVALGSNVLSRNSIFTHLNIKGPLAGYGIVSNDEALPDPTHLCWLNVLGTNAAYNNKFYDFGNAGVYALGLYEVEGRYNFMTGTQSSAAPTAIIDYTGYQVTGSNYYDISLNENTMYNVRYGINVITTPAVNAAPVLSGEVDITNNYIAAVNPAAPGAPAPDNGQYVYKAISVQNLVAGSCADMVSGSEENIDSNLIDSAYNGIYVEGTNCAGQFITSGHNNITLCRDITYTALLAPQAGIEHVNTYSTYIYDNTISGPGYDDPAPPSAFSYAYGSWTATPTPGLIEAVHVADVSKSFTECNTVTQTNTGFYFGGVNTTQFWENNTMNSNAYGYALDGIIGQQPQSATTIPPNTTTGNDWEPSGFYTGTNWQTYTIDGADPTLSWMYVNSVVATQVPTNNFGDGFPYSDIPYMIGLGITDTNTPPEICALPPASHVPYLPIAVMAAQLQLGYTSSSANNMNWIAQMATYRNIAADTAMDTNVVLASFQTMANASRYQYICNVEQHIANADYTDAATLLSYPLSYMASADSSAATGAVMADSEGNSVVSNYKLYYSCLVKYMTDTLNSTDSANVVLLANMCPYVDGQVVYQARALYSLIYNDLRMWNDVGCAPAGSLEERHMAGGGSSLAAQNDNLSNQQYSLSPNPSNGNVTLMQLVPDANPVKAQIWNDAGISVFEGQFHFTGGVTQFSMINKIPGLYLLQLTDSKGMQFMLKFVIE